MRSKLRREQLALEWTDRIRWDELPATARAELQGLLRELLRHGVHAANLVKDRSGE